MKVINKIFQSAFLYPFLFALFPILTLWNTNFGRMGNLEIILPITLSLIISGVVFLLFRLILGNWTKSALFTSLLIFLFFSYGHIFNLLVGNSLFGVRENQPRNFIVAWLIIFLAGSYLIFRYGKKAGAINQFLNVVGVALILMTGIQIGIQQIHAANISRQRLQEIAKAGAASANVHLSSNPNSPDVYLIILDGYMRDDKLMRSYHFDNSAFLKQLTDMGFVIPSCTQSNYTWTQLSMSSELNMNYLDSLGIPLDPTTYTQDFSLLSEFIQHSLVRANFASLGYKMVTFKTSVEFMDITDSDIYIQDKTSFWQNFVDTTEFDDMLSQTSILRLYNYLQQKSPALAKVAAKAQKVISAISPQNLVQSRSFDEVRYETILNDLNQITNVPDIPGKKFVYMHVPAPHASLHSFFILGPDGSFDFQKSQDIGYPNAVTYLNSRIIPILKTIIAKSARPPIIILSGDHGWKQSTNTRPFNLNAYYLPDGGSKIIYPTITPVNTFRSIFNYYFGGNYPQLKNTTYFSKSYYPYKFTEVPIVCPRPK